MAILALVPVIAASCDAGKEAERMPVRITSPTNFHTEPDLKSPIIDTDLPTGAVVEVVRDAGEGWLEICATAGAKRVCGYLQSAHTTWIPERAKDSSE